MRKTSKILVLVLVLAMMFAMASMFTTSAATPEKLYLTPNANWKQGNARFAAYFFGNGETWVSMTDPDGDGIYEVVVPAGYPNVIFCRMNPGATANNWNNKWNQTADLVIPTDGPNHFTVKEGTWDSGGGTWSTYGSTCLHTNLGAEATCTTPQECLDCGDPVVSALGHTYSAAHLCTRCNEQASFTVAGSGAHLGTEWDTGNRANDMTYADGVYTKVYTNVAAGSYALKVARDHDWGTAYPSADKTYTVATTGSTVTVTLKGTTVDIVVEAPHTHVWSDATCTEPQKCECGETQGEALGHDMAPATCIAPATCKNGCGLTEGEALGHTYVLDICLVCYDVRPSLVLGENTVVVPESGSAFGMVYVAEAGTYKVSVSEGALTACIFTDSIFAEGSDFSIVDGTLGASWNNYAVIADLEAGFYYVGVYGAGEYTVTLEETEPVEEVKNTVVVGDNHYIVTDALITTGYEWHLLELQPGTYVVSGGAPMTIFVFHDPYVGEPLDATAPYSWNIDDLTYAYLDSFEVEIKEAGFYWVGFRYDNIGDLREFDFNISLKPAHEHTWVDATCTAPKTCSECGATEGEALGHTFVDGECTVCGEKDPNAVDPDPVDPVDPADPVDPEPEEELNFFQKIIAWFMDLINKFLAIFKK